MLPQGELPRHWYNIQADLPRPLDVPLHPATGQPVKPEDLLPIFPRALIEQEMSRQRWVEIPEEVLRVYRLWRPTPLVRARDLEEALRTPARIYYKYEGVSPPGSHKPNTAVAQAYYNAREGVRRLVTETGAGQWGSALAFAGARFGLQVTVYMVRVSYEQKPYRRTLMEIWGGEVFPSPTQRTACGRRVLEEDPGCPGSLGIAIAEAVEDAASHEDAKYCLGSVLNHVLLHQTVVGLEAKQQFELLGEYPDLIVGCVGGGSNFAGACFPFLRDKIEGRRLRAVAVEPEACPTLTRGAFAYDYGDAAGLTPLLRMYTLGHRFIPPAIHAGGLRYHGMAPLVSLLCREGLIEARAYPQRAVFEAACLFARTEGIVPAPEPAHAIRAVIDEAVRCREEGRSEVIFLALSGHGYLDLSAYQAWLEGRLEDYRPDEELRRSLERLPRVP